MKKIFSIVLFLLVIATLCFAQDRKVVGKSLDSIEKMGQTHSVENTGNIEPAIQYNFEFGLEYTYFIYKEPSLNVKETTDFYGINSAVTGRSKDNDLMARIEAKFAAGPVDYEGQLNNGTPWTDKGDDYLVEIRGLIGRDFALNNSVITPIFGFAYRYLNDQLDSQYAYEREIRYFYSPLGFEASRPLSDTWKIALRAEYDIFWQGRVKSHLSDVNSAFNNLRNKQDSGYGARASIALQKKIKDSMYLAIEPFFKYWEIDKSDNANITVGGTIVGYGYEPANRTKEYGLKVSLIW